MEFNFFGGAPKAVEVKKEEEYSVEKLKNLLVKFGKATAGQTELDTSRYSTGNYDIVGDLVAKILEQKQKLSPEEAEMAYSGLTESELNPDQKLSLDHMVYDLKKSTSKADSAAA